ncbi:MAG: ATP-binding protein, partial [Spirochaetia bacterium]|nr:ATP-binding protein [Spirochaetia bacterium]
MSLTELSTRVINAKALISEMIPIDFSTTLQAMLPVSAKAVDYRFYQVTEIPEEKVSQYRLAMANVFSGMQNEQRSVVYMLSSTEQGVDLYLGIASSDKQIDIPDSGTALKTTFEGNFLGAQLM